MDFENIKKDFDWVIKVLESCKTSQHLTTTIKLFDVFLEKWDWDLSDERKLTFYSVFNRTKSRVGLKIGNS
jgi:hypothetical protein